jgi:hypothetical protein
LLIIAMTVHLFKGLVPTDSCLDGRSNDQLALLDFQIHRSVQVALFNDGLGNSNASGIADANNARFHRFLLHARLSLPV